MHQIKSIRTALIAVVLLGLVSGLYNCSSSNVSDPQDNVKPMLFYAKGNAYKADWTIVDSLEQNGLTKTALEQVNKIYAKAKKDENHEQIVKSLIVKAKLEAYVEENAFSSTLELLNAEAINASYPLKPLLHSIIAELYWKYYQNNRWRFQNRTQTIDFDNNDITTWDLTKITEATIEHYLLSIKNLDSLSRTPTETFSEIILTNTAQKYRPLLYDFLAHRATNYFMNEEPDITKPAYAFSLADSSYMSATNEFAGLEIQTKDSMSLKYYALITLQKLVQVHKDDSIPHALIDVEMKRLKFVRNHASFSGADTLYYKAMTNLYNTYPEEETAAEIVYHLARIHQERGQAYNAKESEKYRWELKQAYVMCKNVVSKYPGSYGADRCKILMHELKRKSLDVKTEKVNVPDQSIKARISYTNISKVYHKLVKVNFDQYKKWMKNDDYRESYKKILSSTEIKTWSNDLPNDGDFQQHSGVFKVDALKKGFYVLLTATTDSFVHHKEAVAITPFWVSGISYMTRRTDKQEVEFFVVDRENGTPMQNVKAKLYYQKYNYTFRKYEWISLGTRTTNSDGYFKVNPGKDYRNFYADFSYGDDRLNTEDSYYQYRYYEDYKTYTRTIFFTDRAIYRPGQTVYFKGIVLETDDESNNKIKTNYPTTVTFYDVNSQKVSTLDLKTNEYGTFSGKFVAPNNGLNGQMYISDRNGSKYFSVEEYKRPKFEVSFEPIKGVYKLNETVNVKGLAKTYSGVPLDEAKVNYRVVRNASFPYWCYYRWNYTPSSPEMEIENGTLTTNDEGNFDISFKAIPDNTVQKKYSPIYSYTVYADVTDINGETHSSTTYVRVGYNALKIAIGELSRVNMNGIDTVDFNTVNLNGQSEPAQGNVKIWSLKMPNRVYREPYWEQGDIRFMNEAEFKESFPIDEYNDENNAYKWDKNIKVYDHDFNTEKRKALTLYHLPEWGAGWYVLEATCKDKFGQEVKEIKYFEVYNNIGKYPPTNDIAWFTGMKTKGEPGENAEFLIASAAKDVNVLYEIEHRNKIVHKEWVKLSNQQKKISIPIKEEYRGGFQVHFTMVKHSRRFNYYTTVTVPHTNKMLDVTFETFRNKLLPGQEEEWKVKIKGKRGEKVAAEMVATLYDASLDAFRANSWGLNVLYYDYSRRYWESNTGFSTANSRLMAYDWNPNKYYTVTKIYDKLNWFGYHYGSYYDYRYRDYDEFDDGMVMGYAESEATEELKSVAGVSVMKPKRNKEKAAYKKSEVSANQDKNDAPGDATTATVTGGDVSGKLGGKGKDFSEVEVRKNFSETAFFYPHLETNDKGEVIIKFTIPEALTKWKFMGLAHTKDLKTGMVFEETVTQKDLMVYPNAPRFFRESDQLIFSSKISNLADNKLEGSAKIEFFDALTEEDITKKLMVSDQVVSFNMDKGKSTSANWSVKIPEGHSAIKYRVLAKAGKFTDGEEMVLPVLTNRMLVTESMPLPVRGKGSHNFKFSKLLGSTNSSTLKHHKLTLEFTSNPAWYAIQSLPYLMEYPYECAEQTFSRFYANSIAAHIANSNPKIKNVFESWKNSSPEAFLSNLEKNQELKSLLLQETPWVLEAQDESERKKRVGLLFDLNRMSNELGRALRKLQKLQVSNGGWTWFKGMPENRYITQHIVTGMGHLDHLGVRNIRSDYATWNMVKKAVRYLDDRIHEDYEWLKKHDVDLSKDHLNQTIIQYLYARSYFLKDVEISSRNKEAYEYYHGQAKQYWLGKSRYMQGMIALALHRDGKPKTGIPVEQKIVASLKDNAIQHEELGMYWKENTVGYYWYQAPIETQALLIEAFDEVANDSESVESMKVWLLKQKQTQDWKTTKATTEACYALLLRGTDLLVDDELVTIKVGDYTIDPSNDKDMKVEAGTGYFKTSWSKHSIKSNMGNVTVTKPSDGVAWGSLYWQYFEQLDKITPHETPLKLNKKLFVQRNSTTGPVITPVTAETKLKPGDKLKVRIELRVDRDMEYVHMKDMRASGLEPINVFSGYRYQDGLGYYESTKDASTNFFFDYLRKGVYVFEYPLRVNLSGNFSNGITTIQCMYAPEFTSHSEGIRIAIR